MKQIVWPLLYVLLAICQLSLSGADRDAPIDRHALVTRHNPTLLAADPNAPLTVGNGRFAFTVDITGLQSFAPYYRRAGIPTETLARWSWHEEPNPNRYALKDTYRDFKQADGRVVGYPTRASTPAGGWLRRNPHNLPLAEIRLEYLKEDGSPFALRDVHSPRQTLDLWSGAILSTYQLDGVAVEVTTVCHPDLDLLGVEIDSELVGAGRLRVKFAFPRGYDLSVKNTPPIDWSRPESHQSKIEKKSHNRVDLLRVIDKTRIHVAVAWANGAELSAPEPHLFSLASRGAGDSLSFSIAFSPQPLPASLPNVEATQLASAAHWKQFWQSGGAVDFSGSTDPRATELERRIILSQYLLAAQQLGEVPPQESGLTCSTWYGKHHTEMIWWHTAHYALWGREQLLAKNLDWYRSRLTAARELARRRGLRGARWAKMVGPQGRESPGGNPLIVWNQPHMVYLCELMYRSLPTRETLDHYRELVLETADCLASMVAFDTARQIYVLGPPLWIAQEIYDSSASQNPSFELAYWRWALTVAQRWRQRLAMERSKEWDHIIQHLAKLPEKDGKYVALESHPDTWENVESRHDHPTMLAPLGVLPGLGVDRATMARTLDAVLQTWDWETKIWGWDYPMIAMTAARLGRPETAVEILLRRGPNNIYLPNGHCPQRSDPRPLASRGASTPKHEIAAYLPANGALLTAVALMVAGCDDCAQPLPCLPRDGRWSVRAEGLRRLP